MKKIYIKNYKGFNEELIELRDVNFFVGENSTGKSSILKLINILSSNEFWFNLQFNNNEVELGYFDEILNKNSSENTFIIGIELNSNNESSNKKTIRILIEFKNENSIPKANRIKYLFDNKNYLISLTTNKQIKYTENTISNIPFLEWARDFTTLGTNKRINIEHSKFPLLIILEIIKSKSNKNHSKVSAVGFHDKYLLFHEYLWLAPIRAKAKRIYESYNIKFSPEGDHIPSLLKDVFSVSSKKNKIKSLEILNKFGKESNLFDEISIKNFASNDVSPFEIQVKYGGNSIKLPNVGYGVSQSLPLIVEILTTKNYCFSIQQPEVHLHPKAQAAFGSFIYQATIKDKNTFLIETHSDFIVNRFRYDLKKHEDNKKINTQVIYFERDNNKNTITHLEINSDGSYINELPKSYLDFYIDEELKLLEV